MQLRNRTTSSATAHSSSGGLGAVMALALIGAMGCTGELRPADVSFMDTDQNGLRDAVDLDRDQVVDYRFVESAEVDGLILAGGWCPSLADVLIDDDGDGIADALDLDCDGNPDVTLFPDGSAGGGQGGGGATSCEASTAVDGAVQRVSCSGTGGTSTCECYVNDQLIQSCSTDAANACVIPGGCCDFGGGTPDDGSDGDPSGGDDSDPPGQDPGDPSGGSASCEASINVNGSSQRVTCQGDGTMVCQCEQDGALVDTCTTTSPSACSLPGGSCCSFQ